MTEQSALIALSMAEHLGPVSIRNILSYCGSACEAIQTPSAKLLKIPHIGQKSIQALKSATTLLHKADKEIEFCRQNAIQILSYYDNSYPKPLKLLHDAPVVLYQKGNVSLNQVISIAIVGTRKPTEYGKEFTELFASYFAERKINVVSGLAYGVDIIAHKAVLDIQGCTTAVLGHGLDIVYPSKHKEKTLQMIENGGLLTEFPSGTKPDAVNFPARNRIIAGISKGIVVIEAAETGGALITAHFGFDQSKEVYALPGKVGDPYSAGCNKLIRKQIAKLVTHPQECLDDLEIHWSVGEVKDLSAPLPSLSPDLSLSADETQVMHCLQKGEKFIDEITLETGIPMSELNALLLMMEFKSLISQQPGKRFKWRGGKN